ncbi:MAG: hypothetical protein Q3W96_07970 [Dysosmobacter sp.]|uniref:hypothetical protein n=1 Tax=Dysosmobacter sp. TaxID=2591382 RepID=UPI00284A5D72|nr:hypothetical protein [Dysosmobacter sp.]MDR3983359.1 hypothetical protein [Dysosmobacter sp.]
MESKETSKKRFYLKWPWNVLVYIILVVLLRIFAIPVILLIMWWNKKQQPDGPEEGYCLQRIRGRLTGLIWAALCLAGGGLAIWFFLAVQTMPYEMERLKEEISFGYYLIPVAGAAAILVGLFLAYRSLRDALAPEKSALAQSIRDQLPYPDEAPPVKELFAMVDQDLKTNGQWCGKLGVGREWVLGDEVSSISRIRGVFSREEHHTRRAGKRTQAVHIHEIWIVDDRRKRQVTSLRSRKELEEAMDCLRRRAPAAVFGVYDSREYKDLVYTEEDEQQYAQERAYRQRQAQFEEQERKEQERLAQNQVLTLPDGSVTSRITGDTIHQLLRQPDETGEPAPFQLVPGVPFQGQGHTFSRLACLAGGAAQPTRILMEEYSGTPETPGQYAWTRDVSAGEAEEVLQGWLRGEIPSLENWTKMERSGRTWQSLDGGSAGAAATPPQPHPDWPWLLTVGGNSGSTSDFGWSDVEKALRALNQEADSYLILEQKDPQSPETCWFLQCAVARQGPDQGSYSVEIGFTTPDGSRLWEWVTPDVQEVINDFSDAYYHRGLDVSGFREAEI